MADLTGFRQMLADRAEADKGLSWDQYLGQFDVIHLVMTDFLEENKEGNCDEQNFDRTGSETP